MRGKAFLGRTIFDERTQSWVFPDGSGRVLDEGRIELGLVVTKREVAREENDREALVDTFFEILNVKDRYKV